MIRRMAIYFSLFIGFLILVDIYDADALKLHLDPEGFYNSKLTDAIEKKTLHEEELTQCLRQLAVLVEGRKSHLQQHMADGYSVAEAAEIWKEEVEITRRFCEMSSAGIDAYQADIKMYKNKIDTLRSH